MRWNLSALKSWIASRVRNCRFWLTQCQNAISFVRSALKWRKRVGVWNWWNFLSLISVQQICYFFCNDIFYKCIVDTLNKWLLIVSSNYATQELKNAICSWVFWSSTDAATNKKKYTHDKGSVMSLMWPDSCIRENEWLNSWSWDTWVILSLSSSLKSMKTHFSIFSMACVGMGGRAGKQSTSPIHNATLLGIHIFQNLSKNRLKPLISAN